jgi:hypothetical protein
MSSLLANPSFGATASGPTNNDNNVNFTYSAIIYPNLTASIKFTNTGSGWLYFYFVAIQNSTYLVNPRLAPDVNLTKTGQSKTVKYPKSGIASGDQYVVCVGADFQPKGPAQAGDGTFIVCGGVVADDTLVSYDQVYHVSYYGAITPGRWSETAKNGATETAQIIQLTATGYFHVKSKLTFTTAYMDLADVLRTGVYTISLASTKSLHFIADTQYTVCVAAGYAAEAPVDQQAYFQSSVSFCSFATST